MTKDFFKRKRSEKAKQSKKPGAVEKMRDNLYSRNFKKDSPSSDSYSVKKRQGTLSSTWNHDKEKPSSHEQEKEENQEHVKEDKDKTKKEETSSKKDVAGASKNKDKKDDTGENDNGFLFKILIGVIVFAVVAFLGAVMWFMGGFGEVSAENVNFTVNGPLSVAGGDELSFDVSISNNNTLPLESARLLVTYPEGARDVTDVSKEVVRTQKTFENIASEEEITEEMDVILFGDPQTTKEITFTLEYTVPNSNAVFSKEATYSVTLTSSPVSLEVEYPDTVNARQDIEFNLTISSNSNTTLKDVLVEADYPFGFTFDEANPQPAYGDNVWRVGQLSPKESRQITLVGQLKGQQNEERSFRFLAGLPSQATEEKVVAPFVEVLKSVSIEEPFIGLSVSLNGSTEGSISSMIGDKTSARVRSVNNLEEKITNAEIKAELSGNVLNRFSISPQEGGFYQSVDNTITWNKNTTDELQEINPNGVVDVGFQFSSLSGSPEGVSTVENPEITMNVSVSGQRFSQNGQTEEVSASQKRVVKIPSRLSLNSSVLYRAGPFQNTGHVPPRADEETTYTVKWSVFNTFNAVEETELRATLPPYVEWVGMTEPARANVSYDSLNREITWDVGHIEPGAGYSSTSPTLHFQVVFLPSVTQVGETPILINKGLLLGRDTFTNSTFNYSFDSVGINVSEYDTAYDRSDDKVRR